MRLLTISLCALSLLACGGAVIPDGSSSSSSGGSTPGVHAPAESSRGVSSGTTHAPAHSGGTWSTDAWGCRDFELYAHDATRARYLVIVVDAKARGLTNDGDTATVVIDPATASGTRVEIHAYARPQENLPYCSDYDNGADDVTSVAPVVAGTLSIRVSTKDSANGSYNVTVTAAGLQARNADGTLESIPDLTFADVRVGWLPG
ncbi:MAG: hypothetical protein JWP97_812 [Labilithrix sp.]|nr:hypothetical protein [Labilithrix sp.]